MKRIKKSKKISIKIRPIKIMSFNILAPELLEAFWNPSYQLKKPTKKELEIMPQTRRGIVANKYIKKNQIITKDLITFKRPATGIKMKDVKLVIGKKSKKNLLEDEPIKFSYLKK